MLSNVIILPQKNINVCGDGGGTETWKYDVDVELIDSNIKDLFKKYYESQENFKLCDAKFSEL